MRPKAGGRGENGGTGEVRKEGVEDFVDNLCKTW